LEVYVCLIFNFTTLSQQWELNNITILWVSSYVPVNLGGLLLQALLEFWPRTHINPMEEEENEEYGEEEEDGNEETAKGGKKQEAVLQKKESKSGKS